MKKYILKIEFLNVETGLSEITDISSHCCKFTRWWKKYFTVGYIKTIRSSSFIHKYELEPKFIEYDKELENGL